MNNAKRISRLLDLNRQGITPHDPNDSGLVSAEWRNAGGIYLLRGKRPGEPKPPRKKPWKRTYAKKSSPSSDAENSKKAVSDSDVVTDLLDMKNTAISKTGTSDTPKDSTILWGIPDLVRRAGSFLISWVLGRRTKKPPSTSP